MTPKDLNLFEQFMRHIANERRLSAHTVLAYRTDLEQFIDFIKKECQIEQPEKADFKTIRSWTVSLVESKLDNRSINRKLATLRSFFGYLLRRQEIPVNPMLRVSALKTDKKLPAFVEETAVQTLLTDVEFPLGFIGIRDRLVLELLYGTGIRLAELLGLKNNDFDHYEQSISVTGKRNKSRKVPITKPLAKLIQDYIIAKGHQFTDAKTNALIVTDKGDESYPVHIQRLVKKYLTFVTTIKKRSPHVLRHTYATHLLNHGADLNAIKDLLGHQSLAATQVYTHNSIEKLKKVFEQAHPKA
jgi:integrase/recombinase XerC